MNQLVPPPPGRSEPTSWLAFKKYESTSRWTIVRHPDCVADGLIHADNVIAFDKPIDGDDATRTTLPTPSNDIAPP